MDFNVLDKVVLTKKVDGALAGTIGVIADTTKHVGYDYTIYLLTNTNIGHDADYVSSVFLKKYNVANNENAFYYVPEDCIRLVTDKETKKYKKCSVCGNINLVSNMQTNSKGKYVCYSCTTIKGYSTKNNRRLYNPSSTHKTYGFEFECVPKHHKDFDGHIEMVSSKYGFIPTSDCSLPCGGVEYKTPTINGLRGVRHMFNEVYNMVSFRSYKCGQHINIGDSKYIDNEAMHRIRSYKDELFNNLTRYMSTHTDDVVRVCGRDFCQYADASYRYVHGSWLNLENDNRLEFRISKFKNPTQYFELVNMWTEMLDTIINDFIIPYDDNRPNKNYCNAKKASEHIVRIFKCYASGNASIQKRDKAIKSKHKAVA